MRASVLVRLCALLFLLSEIGLLILRRARARGRVTRLADEGSTWLLWTVILCGVAIGMVSDWIASPELPGPHWLSRGVAAALIVSGLAVRWAAISTLGRFFTVNVAIHEEHVLVSGGLYRYIRHPSYTGLLMALAGLGISFDSWVAVLALTVPPFMALRMRMRTEEAALLKALGPPYRAYCERTKRLLPGIY